MYRIATFSQKPQALERTMAMGTAWKSLNKVSGLSHGRFEVEDLDKYFTYLDVSVTKES